jgi:hypothetical protein
VSGDKKSCLPCDPNEIWTVAEGCHKPPYGPAEGFCFEVYPTDDATKLGFVGKYPMIHEFRTAFLNWPRMVWGSQYLFPEIKAPGRAGWTGLHTKGVYVVPSNQAGAHTFRIAADDGVRFVFDGKVLIDQNQNQNVRVTDLHLNLTAGEHPYEITYFQSPAIFYYHPPGSTFTNA